MKWIKMSLKTTVEAEDLVSCTLAELGVEGIEIEDKVPLTEEEKARMFIDILPDLGEDDGEAVVSFYLDSFYPEFCKRTAHQILSLYGCLKRHLNPLHCFSPTARNFSCPLYRNCRFRPA